MRIFDVFVNDRKLCRAGVGANGVLNAIITWVKLTGAAAAEARDRNAPVEELRLHVGGLRQHTHHRWAEQALDVGDRIIVDVGSARRADKPRHTKVDDPHVRKYRERQYYERLKRKFDPDRSATPDKPSNHPKESVPSDTQFLNVDLDIWSHAPLERLVAAFGTKVIVLHAGKHGKRHAAHLELASTSTDADGTIRRFAALIDDLPRSSRSTWDRTSLRQFNVGVQAGRTPHAYELRLRPATVEAASRVGAQIVFTIYANQDRQP